MHAIDPHSATLHDPKGLDPSIVALSADSRQVGAGTLFAGLPGAKQDGARFAAAAVHAGAAALLVGQAARLEGVGPDVPVLRAANPRRAWAQIASCFHAPQPRHVVAVTGTNGKTSVAYFARALWQALGHRAASLGTLGLIGPDKAREGGLTTADPVALHRDLAELARDGVQHVALEASSHGLDQFRLDGVRFAAGAFTNLSRDHLDYHADMEAYFAAKRRLFAELLVPGAAAVINADVAQAGTLGEDAQRRGLRLIRYGFNGVELRLLSVEAQPDGQRLTLEIFGQRHQVRLPLVGAFQAANALAALGLVIATGAAPADAAAALASLKGAPGRVQHVASLANGASVYVDYAHTPDALETVLNALRPHAHGRLVVAFGCGGDRDAGKRPIMGAIATRLADFAYVTDDNPRSEDAAAIRRAIVAACAPGRFAEIGDRARAIATAIGDLRGGDLLVIAGKGHERGQIVGAKVLPFDDAEAARSVAAKLGGRP